MADSQKPSEKPRPAERTLTEIVTIDGQVMAFAYKIEGRRITRIEYATGDNARDALRNVGHG